MEGDGENSWRQFLDSKTNRSDPIEELIRETRVSNFDSRGKKAILLTILEDWLTKASIEEWMVEALELLEEVYCSEGSLITPAMAAAYCSVAVDCTMRYLEIKVSHYPAYLKAVDRIWRPRFHYMDSASAEGSSLFSDELKQWRSEFEASISDSLIMYKLTALAASLNPRRDAINNLKVFLDETRVNYGPSPAERASPLGNEKDNQLHKNKLNAINLEEVDLAEMDPSMSKIDPEKMDPSSSKVDSGSSHEVPNETTSAPTNVNRPSLMESSSPARSHESNDSIHDLLGGNSDNADNASRFHLPTPKRKRFSPLKSYETPKTAQRRKVKRWSKLEEETLKTAIRKFGEGSWKPILNFYEDVFDERTTGDLKDKWRNMKQQRGK